MKKYLNKLYVNNKPSVLIYHFHLCKIALLLRLCLNLHSMISMK